MEEYELNKKCWRRRRRRGLIKGIGRRRGEERRGGGEGSRSRDDGAIDLGDGASGQLYKHPGNQAIRAHIDQNERASWRSWGHDAGQ